MEYIEKALNESYELGKKVLRMGEVATYIPELSKADKYSLGVSLYLKNGQTFNLGDVDTRFTIQSISKIINLITAINLFGEGRVFDKVGAEPSGEAFNSLIELDTKHNKPFNPMVNSGAIAVASMLVGHVSFEDMTSHVQKICHDEEIILNEDVYNSEMANISRNRSIAYLLESKGIMMADVEESLEFYTKMCSLNVTSKNLARMAAILAMDGIDPDTGEQLVPTRPTEIVKTIMLTCGMYDGSGEFALNVGIPTKSGVGGGLLSVADNRMGIGVYGPSLDRKGNCVAARPLLEHLSRALKLHIFDQSSPIDDIS